MQSVATIDSGWQVMDGPAGVDRGGFDGAVWCWALKGPRGERADVFVHICGGVLATPLDIRAARATAAIASHGRTEIDAILADQSPPPRLIEFTSDSTAPRITPAFPLAA